MPLHDWTSLSGWDGVFLLWMTELLRLLKSRLPQEFRAYLGTGPAVAIGAPAGRPDVSVRTHGSIPRNGESFSDASSVAATEPDVEVAVAALEAEPSLLIEREGRLVAAVELVCLLRQRR
jgi:hypothetical protein